MDEELLEAVKDALAQYDQETADFGMNFEDAMLNLQAVYDRLTGQKDYQETRV